LSSGRLGAPGAVGQSSPATYTGFVKHAAMSSGLAAPAGG